MAFKRKHVKHSVIFLLVLGVCILGGAVFAYKKLADVKKNLALLVELETDGEYRLEIGKDRFDWRYLLLELYDVSLVNVNDTNDRSVQSVEIPYVQLNVGDLRSLIWDDQLVIDRLIIDEPLVHIATHQQHIHKIHLAQTLVKIYPAVETVLKHFSVRSFVINRGNLKIKKEGSDPLHFKFIDFLVHEWNMEHLTKDSHIRLSIDGQKLKRGASAFEFSSIEFNYPAHELSFRDFSFESEDSVTHSKLKVEGKAVFIQGLDYLELYHHQRYKLRKIEIQKPTITGNFIIGKGKTKKEVYPLATILHQTFGEVHLDTALIQKASVHLQLQHGKNVIKTSFPQIDFNLNHFGVMKDSADLQIGALQVFLDNTAIRLNQEVELRCAELNFIRGQYLEIQKAQFFEIKGKKPFVECGKIYFHRFKLLEFLFTQNFVAASAVLENASIFITPRLLDLFPLHSGDSSFTKQKKPQQVELGLLSLQNVSFHYQAKQKSFQVKGVTARVKKIRSFSPEAIASRLEWLEIQQIAVQDQARLLKGEIQAVRLDQRYLNIQKLAVSYAQMKIQGNGILMERSLSQDPFNYTHWEKVAWKSISVKGEIPIRKEEENSDTVALPSFVLHQLNVHKLAADVKVQGKKLSFSAENFKGQELRNKENVFPYGQYTGKIYDFHLEDSLASTIIDSLLFDSHKHSRVFQVHVKNKETEVKCKELLLGKWKVVEGNTEMEAIHASGIDIRRHQLPFLKMDSLIARTLHFQGGKKPHVGEIMAYHPVVQLAKPNKEAKHTSFHFPLEEFPAISLYKTELLLPNKQKVRIHKVKGKGSIHHPTLSMDSVFIEGEKATLQVTDFSIQDKQLSIRSLHVTPTSWFLGHQLEEGDIAKGTFEHISFTDFKFDSLLEEHVLAAHELKIGQFFLDVQRDKRLPNPGKTEKPFQLHELIPPMLHLQQIRLEKGSIRYQEISDKTEKQGEIELDNIYAFARGKHPGQPLSKGVLLDATTRLYNQAPIRIRYEYKTPSQFQLQIEASRLELPLLNRIAVPLQAVEIKSGYLDTLYLDVLADKEHAMGHSTITYRGLHLEIMKRNDPGKKNFKSEFLTFLADGFILKNGKEKASVAIKQARRPEKSIFNYWVKIASHGALNAVLHGKQEKTEKLAKK